MEGTNDLSYLETRESGLIENLKLVNEVGLATDRLPGSIDEAAIVEKLLIEDLKKLSLVEHEKVMFDLHGFTEGDEDPEDIDDILAQLENEVRRIRKKEAYMRASYLNEKFVNDRDFRLMFLRCDGFDTKLAAQRLVKHFSVKKKLFGDGDVLARDVLLSDLSEQDLEALESGFLQVFPTRDMAGRPVFCIAPMHRPPNSTVESCSKAMWYVLNTTMKDKDAQQKGVVGVHFNVGKKAQPEPFSLMQQVQRIRVGIPKKMVGMHYCCDDTLLRPFVAGMQLFLDKDARARFRPHFGNSEDIKFKLQTYGIPTKMQPIGPNGELSLGWHQEWLQIRQNQEENEAISNGVILPRRFDVLFGRGKKNREHTGNLRASHLVEMYQDEYEKAGKFEKTEVAARIVGIINESYGRFLKWEEGGWVEVDHEAAREKISHFFRHLRSKKLSPDDSFMKPSQYGVKRVTTCPSPRLLSDGISDST